MTPLCRRCHEPVDPHDRLCVACGADLRVEVPVLVDLTAPDAEAERERDALVAAVAAASADGDHEPPPGWLGHAPTMLALEHDPVRLQFGATARPGGIDDVLPAPRASRWGRRRR